MREYSSLRHRTTGPQFNLWSARDCGAMRGGRITLIQKNRTDSGRNEPQIRKFLPCASRIGPRTLKVRCLTYVLIVRSRIRVGWGGRWSWAEKAQGA